MVNALQHDRARKVAVVTPYGEEVNTQLSAFLESADIGVVRLASLNAPDVTALGRITAQEVRDLARKTMGADCDALFIGCSQLPTHAILAGLAVRIQSAGLVLDQRHRMGRRAVARDGVRAHLRPITRSPQQRRSAGSESRAPASPG